MSYPADERHERESAASSTSSSANRNATAEKEKSLDKPSPKTLPGQVPTSEVQQSQRQSAASMKTGKPPLPNRPIAPAAATASNLLAMSGHLGPGYLPTNMPGFSSTHLMSQAIPMPASMIRGPMTTPHPFSPHVPVGAAAAAMAGAAPRSISSLRAQALLSAPKSGVSSHLQGPVSTVQSQTSIPSVSLAVTVSRPLSPASASSATNAVIPTFYQQSSEHKQPDIRDGRSPLLTDLARRTGSPHCPSPTGSVAVHPMPTSNTKALLPGQVISSHKPAPAVMLPHFSQTHSPMSVGSIAQSAVANSIQQTVSGALGPHQATVMPGASGATLANKMYSPHMNYAVGKQALVQQPEGSGSADISRLSGKSSPITVQQHSSSSTTATTGHVIAPSPTVQNSIVSDSRMERTHQAISLANPMYHHSMAPYLFNEHIAGYSFPAPFGYGPHPSSIRSSHAATTAAAAAQVAAATAVMNPLIVDPARFIALTQQAGALGSLAASGMPSDMTGSTAMMDGTNPSIYSMSMLSMSQAANLQVPISAGNPNATSPRPSILRKRTSEGLRKATVVPYNDGISTAQAEPAASPRSDSTLSAPQSGQNSPKPPSDSGSQANEQVPPPAPSTATATSDLPPVTQSAPASPAKVKKELVESSVSATVNAVVTASCAVTTMSTSTLEKPAVAAVALPDGASPRKKPRKQNVVVTEDKYGSSVPIEEASSDEEEKKVKQQPPEENTTLDDDLKFILLKRPKISIFGGYKVNTKAAHNHFLRYSDVKLKEERKPTVQDMANQKGIVHRASGWRVQHIAAQMDELNGVEQEVLKRLFELREKLPKPRSGQKTKYQDELLVLDELVQGNIQRSQLVAEQLGDTRKSMVKVLEHRSRCVEIIQKYMNKRNPKKKS